MDSSQNGKGTGLFPKLAKESVQRDLRYGALSLPALLPDGKGPGLVAAGGEFKSGSHRGGHEAGDFPKGVQGLLWLYGDGVQGRVAMIERQSTKIQEPKKSAKK